MKLTVEQIKQARREFHILIDRCGCSQASISVTPKEAKEMNRIAGIPEGHEAEYAMHTKPHAPSCKPHKCYPTLTKLLYPKGGLNKKSDMCIRATQQYEEKLIKEEKENE